MENYDPEMAKRVWQRVQGETAQETVSAVPPSAQALAAAELEQASRFLRLSGQLPGREKALLRRLYEEEKSHAGILRGIQLLTAGKCPAMKMAAAHPMEPEVALRKCYGAALRAEKEYENRAADPEYGPAFAELARQERIHCVLLLEVLGRLKG